MSEHYATGETRLALFGRAQLGRDIYRAIREKVNDCRRRGIEPKVIWAGQDSVDAIHALWTAVAAKYDLTIPPGVAGVPMRLGHGIGRSQFVFEYHDSGAANAAKLKPARNDPLAGND